MSVQPNCRVVNVHERPDIKRAFELARCETQKISFDIRCSVDPPVSILFAVFGRDIQPRCDTYHPEAKLLFSAQAG
jgi:hypothetical protein